MSEPETPAPPTDVDDGQDRSTFLRRVQSAWRDTVGAYATDEATTKNLFGRLAEFGSITGDEAKRLVAESKDRIEQNRKELEERVEESIKTAMSHVKLPSPGEVAELEQKVESIEARIKSLESGGSTTAQG